VQAILLGIDGTGGIGKTTYPADMHNSFVSYIIRHTSAKMKQYIRGPGFDGIDMASIVASGYAFVHLNLIAHKDAPVFLTGYSRGGAGVIGIAQRLEGVGVKVAAMMLFDAVDRAIGIDTAEIPRNVERVVYARRDPDSASRGSFGNCGTHWRAQTKCDMQYFRGTHGALGGVPWPVPPGGKATDLISEGFPEMEPTKVSYAQDLHAAQEVWTWVKPRISALGFLGQQPGTRTTV
jgi:hypothetical protein